MIDPNSPYICNGCGARRKTSNHWFIMQTTNRILKIKSPFNVVYIASWEEHLAQSALSAHLCGRECVQKAVNYFIERGTLDGFIPASLAADSPSLAAR